MASGRGRWPFKTQFWLDYRLQRGVVPFKQVSDGPPADSDGNEIARQWFFGDDKNIAAWSRNSNVVIGRGAVL